MYSSNAFQPCVLNSMNTVYIRLFNSTTTSSPFHKNLNYLPKSFGTTEHSARPPVRCRVKCGVLSKSAAVRDGGYYDCYYYYCAVYIRQLNIC